MKAPGRQFWLGTDNLGRDICSRVVYGARISVTVGFATVALATLLAAVVGISSAYFGGVYDIWSSASSTPGSRSPVSSSSCR